MFFNIVTAIGLLLVSAVLPTASAVGPIVCLVAAVKLARLFTRSGPSGVEPVAPAKAGD